VRALLIMLAAALAAPAHAQQAYPSKPVRLIVPYAASGVPDVLARVVAQSVSPDLGQPVVIDNKPGAGTIIGAEAAAKSAPDGYTLFLMDASSFAIMPAVQSKLPYDPIRDFAPITQGVRGLFFLIANASLGVGTVQELVSLAKAQPGRINYASAGTVSVHHLAMEQLKVMAKIDMVHIPYKGVIEAVPALLANDASVMFNALPSMIQHVKSGKLRILAVGSAQRVAVMPDVPTVAEAGFPDFALDTMIGFAAPAGTPRAIVERLNGALVKSLRSSEVQTRMQGGFGLEVVPSTPEQFGEYIRRARAYYAKLVKDINLKLD
jgi:tripartite-type tricarboxylate transporter receptor subunit TctC